jgi:hypothetical protein
MSLSLSKIQCGMSILSFSLRITKYSTAVEKITEMGKSMLIYLLPHPTCQALHTITNMYCASAKSSSFCGGDFTSTAAINSQHFREKTSNMLRALSYPIEKEVVCLEATC